MPSVFKPALADRKGLWVAEADSAPLRQVKLGGLEKVDWLFVFSCAAHNLIRLPKLLAQSPGKLREQCVPEQRLQASGMIP